MGLFDNNFKKKTADDKINIGGKEYSINPEAWDFSQNGLEKHQQGDFTGAVTEYSKAINVLPKNQLLYILRGMAYLGNGFTDEAKKDFHHAVELLPNEFIAAYRLGMIYYLENDIEKAISWLKKSYSNAEDYHSEHFLFIDKKLIANNLGCFLLQVERVEEGIKYLNEAISLDPAYSNPQLSKGLALCKIGNYSEAFIYINKAVELGNQNAIESLKMVKKLILSSQNIHKSNPLNIIDDTHLQRLDKLPDLSSTFEKAILYDYQVLKNWNGRVTVSDTLTLIIYFTIFLLIEYKKKKNNEIPISIIEEIKHQVMNAAQNIFENFREQEIIDKVFASIDEKIWENDIIKETEDYMNFFN
jgi:Flp pilus assembly protein TadD